MATVSTSARLREVIQREMANPDSLVATLKSQDVKPASAKSNGTRKKLAPVGRTRN